MKVDRVELRDVIALVGVFLLMAGFILMQRPGEGLAISGLALYLTAVLKRPQG